MILQDLAGLAFVGGIALGLDGPDRDFPPHLLGPDRLVVPVGPFDQADGDSRVLLPGPLQKPLQVLVCILEIGLQHDADVGVILVLQLQAAEHLQGDVLEAVGFHVDAEETVQFDDLGADAPHLLEDGVHRAFKVLGIGQAEERSRLDRHVDLGCKTPVQGRIAPGAGQPLPPLLFLLQHLQQFQIGIHIFLSLFLGESSLAQHVHHCRKVVLAQFFHVLDGFLGVFADDELAGHLLDVGRDHLVEHRPAQRAEHPGHPGAGGEHRRHILFLAEILADVVGQQLGGGQGWKSVHKAEHLNLELLVLHAPVHDLAHPGPFVEERGLLAGDGGEKFLAPIDDFRIQHGVVHSPSY